MSNAGNVPLADTWKEIQQIVPLHIPMCGLPALSPRSTKRDPRGREPSGPCVRNGFRHTGHAGEVREASRAPMSMMWALTLLPLHPVPPQACASRTPAVTQEAATSLSPASFAGWSCKIMACRVSFTIWSSLLRD